MILNDSWCSGVLRVVVDAETDLWAGVRSSSRCCGGVQAAPSSEIVSVMC